MKIGCLKFNCSECCKCYWITLLSREARKIAKALGLSEKEFIERKCLLIVHLYPHQESGDGLTINSQRLPKKIALFVEQDLGFIPRYFLVLPSIALKRNSKGECIFIRNGRCEIHAVAPAICKLFPFVSLGKSPLREVYPFCVAIQQKGFENVKGGVDEGQRKRVNRYFDAVERKGFLGQWEYLPSKGIVLLKGEKEAAVSKKEFLQLTKAL